MNLINLTKEAADIFWKKHSNLSHYNERFRNLHSGETCYIFANGGSLKFYDISQLNPNITMCCTFSLIDKRIQKLKPQYNVFTDSYIFYPILFNTYPFVRRVQKNEFASVLKEIIFEQKEIHSFCNVTNCYALKKFKNVSYFHHYGARKGNSSDLTSEFSVSGSALEIMLGISKFMGIKKCFLFGCDYLYDVPLLGHFYADYVPFAGSRMDEYRQRFQYFADFMDIVVVRPEGASCSFLDSVSYEEYFGIERSYQNNTDFIEQSILERLRRAHKKYQIMMEPF